MKNLFLLLSTIFLLTLLLACTVNTGTPIEPSENNMIINIKNNADFEFYGLDTKLIDHSLGTVNADSSKIEKGESLRFEFLKEDFPLDGEVEMEVVILNDNNERIPIENKNIFELASNKEIFFELTGDSIREADIKRVK
jgi:hypothetical protein